MTQEPIMIGYLGELKLTHGYLAAKYFKKALEGAGIIVEQVKLLEKGYKNHEAVADAVKKGEVSFGLIAVENSYEGIVQESALILSRKLTGSDVRICCEIKIPIEHYLISLSKDIEKIKKIYAHKVAHGQCRHVGLPRVFSGRDIEFEETKNTAEAAEKMSQDPESAALLTEDGKCKENYGKEFAGILEILAYGKGKEGVHDEEKVALATRFLAISSTHTLRCAGAQKILDDKKSELKSQGSGNERATVLFTLDRNKSGELFKVLEVFAKKEINISIATIYPCPIPSKPFEYNFLLDCDLVREKVSYEEQFTKAIDEYNLTSGHHAIVLGRYPIIDLTIPTTQTSTEKE